MDAPSTRLQNDGAGRANAGKELCRGQSPDALVRSDPAYATRLRPVRCQSGGPRPGLGCLELVWDVLSPTVVHLIGCLSSERGVGDLGVVCLDIERDEPSHGLDVFEGMEVEPLVLEGRW